MYTGNLRKGWLVVGHGGLYTGNAVKYELD